MKIAFALLLSLLLFSCDDEDPNPDNQPLPSDCDKAVILDRETYDTASTAWLSVIDLTIDEDCLQVKYSASGCDGSSWDLDLVDSEGIAESLPPQRFLRLLFTNNEACLAVFQDSTSFDLTELRVEESSVWLNIGYVQGLDSLETSILYEYEN